MHKLATAILGVAMMIAVAGAPILHNMIPHIHGSAPTSDGVYSHADHDDGHQDQKESVVWSSLHSALRHEDKKLLIAILAILSTALVILSRALIGLAFLINRSLEAHRWLLAPLDPQRGRLLSRGISPYRRFG